MSKQMTKKERQEKQARRERTVKVFDWVVGVPVVVFLVLWLVGGVTLTLVAVFAGSALTFGLAGPLVALVGFGLTFGVAWGVLKGFGHATKGLQGWAQEAGRDHEGEARREQERVEYQRVMFGRKP